MQLQGIHDVPGNSPRRAPGPCGLVADIGGTHARFALVRDAGSGPVLSQVRQYRVEDFPVFEETLEAFLGDVRAELGTDPRPAAACLALAGPVGKGAIQFTNSAWAVEPARLEALLGRSTLMLINDFEAAALAVPGLADEDLQPLDDCVLPSDGVRAVCGPGTGLGVCGLVPTGRGGWQALAGEGGHVDFAPVTALEIEVLRVLQGDFGRVSYERVLSGPGLANLYRALACVTGREATAQAPAAITSAALEHHDALARDTLDMFCALLGAFAGNLALTFGARGGVFLAGGIVPRIRDVLGRSAFRERFEAKGRFRTYLRAIPTRVVLAADLGLLGAARQLREHLAVAA